MQHYGTTTRRGGKLRLFRRHLYGTPSPAGPHFVAAPHILSKTATFQAHKPRNPHCAKSSKRNPNKSQKRQDKTVSCQISSHQNEKNESKTRSHDTKKQMSLDMLVRRVCTSLQAPMPTARAGDHQSRGRATAHTTTGYREQPSLAPHDKQKIRAGRPKTPNTKSTNIKQIMGERRENTWCYSMRILRNEGQAAHEPLERSSSPGKQTHSRC